MNIAVTSFASRRVTAAMPPRNSKSELRARIIDLHTDYLIAVEQKTGLSATALAEAIGVGPNTLQRVRHHRNEARAAP